MHTYDIIMVVILLAGLVFGAIKGLAWQIASISSIVVSYWVANNFHEPLSKHLIKDPWWEKLNWFLAMLILYVGTSIAIWIIFRQVSKMIERIKLKEFDRQAGAILGLVKGGLLCVVVTLFALTVLSEEQEKSVIHSHSGYYIAVFLDKVHPLMPEKVHDALHDHFQKLDERLGDDYERTARRQDDLRPALPPTKTETKTGGLFDPDFDQWAPNP